MTTSSRRRTLALMSAPMTPPELRHARRLPLLRDERCTGCGRCLTGCAHGVLAFSHRNHRKVMGIVEPTACTGCMACVPPCPVGALVRPAA